MFIRVRLTSVVVALGLATFAIPATGQSRTLSGVSFVVDTSGDIVPPRVPAGDAFAMLKSLGMRITFAGRRGRIDVLARPDRPAIRIGDDVFAHWLAMPGDYYLFDSTGFILVRPATKRFFTFRLGDASFNYAGRRDGWPGFFVGRPTTSGTVDDTAAPELFQHGELAIYWHLDVLRDTVCVVGDCSVEELSRGRTPIVDAPPEELTVVRWFGPAQSLAELSGGVGRLGDKPVRLTTTATSSNTGGLHRLLDLHATTIDAQLLVLPSDFTEAQWPGFDRAKNQPALSADRGARWRSLP